MHSDPSGTIEQDLAFGAKRGGTFKTIAFIAFVCCFVAAEFVVLVAGISDFQNQPLALLLNILYAPFLLTFFGWFLFPIAFLLVALMWSCYNPNAACAGRRKLPFVVASVIVGSFPFFFFRVFENAIDPLLGGLCGALGAALIIRWKTPSRIVPAANRVSVPNS